MLVVSLVMSRVMRPAGRVMRVRASLLALAANRDTGAICEDADLADAIEVAVERRVRDPASQMPRALVAELARDVVRVLLEHPFSG